MRRGLVNVLTDERRRGWWRRERPVAAPPDRPDVEAANTGLTEGLRTVLGDLPPRMRAALVFRYVYDLDVAATADALSCPEGTVKSQTARALDRVRAVLGHAAPALS